MEATDHRRIGFSEKTEKQDKNNEQVTEISKGDIEGDFSGGSPWPRYLIELSDMLPNGAVPLLWKFPEHTQDPFVQH
jgi:hypothetical protein